MTNDWQHALRFGSTTFEVKYFWYFKYLSSNIYNKILINFLTPPPKKKENEKKADIARLKRFVLLFNTSNKIYYGIENMLLSI